VLLGQAIEDGLVGVTNVKKTDISIPTVCIPYGKYLE